MRHGKKVNHLGRKSAHRKALMSNMASNLIEHKRIKTTLAKAKALRTYIEPLITKAKSNTTHSRRVVFSYLQNKETTTELFDVIGPKVAERPGGYTRVLRTGFRLGDSAETAIIELVDFNEDALETAKPKRKRTRRGRRKSSEETTTTAPLAEEQTETPAEPTANESTEEQNSSEESKEDNSDKEA